MSEPFEFLIEVVDRIAEGYRLRVAFPDPDSPTGVGENRTVAPIDPADAELRGRLAVLPTSVLASAAKARSAANPLEEAARDIGDRLFRAVTVGETLGDLSRLRRRALAAGADVRITLRIQAPELAALPWEYLFDARSDKREFIGRACMVTRSAGAFGAVPRLPVTGPLRVLGMVSLPGDQVALDARRERDALSRALAPMAAAGRVELHWIPATKQALLAATQSGTWHAFHYIGHGDFDAASGDGRLAFTGPDGGTDFISARQLAAILGTHPTLRLAVLNACQSSAGSAEDSQAGIAAALVHAGLPAVVAMQFPITDDAAPVFSQAFYEGLAAGRGVDQCVRAGRTAITLANDASLEWGTPVLHLRSADGVLFGFTDASAAGATTGSTGATGRVMSEADSRMAETMLLPLPPELAGEDPLLATQLQSALFFLAADFGTAFDAIIQERFDDALVAKLENIFARYSDFYGPDNDNTLKVASALSQARRGLDEVRWQAVARPSRPTAAPQPVTAGSTFAPEDEEDSPRRKTVRTAKPRTERPALKVRVTHGFTLWVQNTRVRSLAAAPIGGLLRIGVGGDNGVAAIHSTRDVLTQPAPGPHELRHTESDADGRDAGPAAVHAIRFDPAGRTVACLAGSGFPPDHLVVWTMQDVSAHKYPGGVFAYLPASERYFLGSAGVAQLGIRRFDPAAASFLPLPDIETVFAAAASRDGGRLAAVGQTKTRIWNTPGELVRQVPSASRAKHVAFTPDGDHVVVPESATSLAVYEIDSGRRTAHFPLEAGASHAWEVGGSGLLVTTTEDGLQLWDLAGSGRHLHEIPGTFATTVRPAFTPAGDVLVARSVDGHHVRTFGLDVVPVG